MPKVGTPPAAVQPKPTKKSKKTKLSKPPKPYKDFPLSPHNSGKWQKKINGKIYYFGRWGRVIGGRLRRVEGDGWREALELYTQQRDDLYAGQATTADGEQIKLKDVANHFLTEKERLLDSGELSKRTFKEYKETCDRLIATFGSNRSVSTLAPGEFSRLRASIAESWGPVRLGNEVGRIRGIFKYAYEADLIDKPVKFGPTFKKPTAKTLRKHRAGQPEKFFEACEINAMLKVASPVMKAMILLGVNCGFGPTDCGLLKKEVVDLDGGFIDYARSKTGALRRNPLWPETIAAIQGAMSPADSELVFVTSQGNPWSNGTDQMVSGQMRFVMEDADCYVAGRGHYALRHVLETIGGESKDQVAVDALMGHIDSSVAATYRERISDERLVQVTSCVRNWLFGEGGDHDRRVP
ncbi:tyrosine-type recombinase/integrase [Fuerstiella marisgermanici]|uniref:Phage integrase family protein n=1 Tax=Fuerstiella marisgermanici TaxID=1891926 RepID=A0A1P8WBV5_9PLAN|nr:site-specific integrase [Fuerstiella marisgermanici]APZ91548.1 Phage integrase family protein [Fuerstiella marisgermanici]